MYAEMPPYLTTIIKPTIICPFSKPNELWLLKMTLYGLQSIPYHWSEKITIILREMGLTASSLCHAYTLLHSPLGTPPSKLAYTWMTLLTLANPTRYRKSSGRLSPQHSRLAGTVMHNVSWGFHLSGPQIWPATYQSVCASQNLYRTPTNALVLEIVTKNFSSHHISLD